MNTLPGDRWSYATVLAGLVLAVIHVDHSYEMLYYGPMGVILEGLVPLAIAAIVTAAGPGLAYAGYDRGDRGQVVKWMAIGGILVGLLFAWSLSHQYVLGLPFPHREYVMSTNVTVGALIGGIIGLYDVRSKRHRRAVEDERETVTFQRTRLSVLHRVLRHNLRNDATVIMGTLEEIARRSSGEVAELARQARERTADLVAMSDKSRRFDQALSLDGPPRDIDLEEIIEDRVDEYCEGDDVELTCSVPEGMSLRTHPELLGELIDELVSNAVEHTDAERPSVSVTAERREDGWTELSVADDGPGIPPIERESLEADVETDLEHTSGVGLWFVQWGAETLEGEVTFVDRDPRGTIATIRLPPT